MAFVAHLWLPILLSAVLVLLLGHNPALERGVAPEAAD